MKIDVSCLFSDTCALSNVVNATVGHVIFLDACKSACIVIKMKQYCYAISEI